MLEFHGRIRKIRRRAQQRVLDVVRLVEIVENSRKQGQGSRKVHLDVQQALHRPVQPVDERHRRRDGTDRQIRVALRDDQIAAGEVDQQRPDLGEHAHHHPEPLAGALFLDVVAGHLFVDLHKALVLHLFLRKQLYEQRTGDGQRLVHHLVHLVRLRPGFRQQFKPRDAHLFRGNDEQRHDGDADDGQPRAHGEQGDDRGHDRRDIADHRRERAGDDAAHPVDIGIHARDDVALLFRREKRMGHALQVGVHLVLHVEDDAGTDPRVDVALQHADDLRQRHGGEGRDQ